MFRIYLLSIAFIFSVSQAFSIQDTLPFRLDWGSENKQSSSSLISKMFMTDTVGFYLVKEKEASFFSGESSKIIVEYFDQNNNLRKSKEVDLKYNGKKRTFYSILYWKGESYILTTFRNRKTETNYLFAQRFDKQSLNLHSKIIKIGEIADSKDFNPGYFNLRFSKDSSKVLVLSDYNNDDSKDAYSIGIFNPSFQPISEKIVTIKNSKQNNFQPIDYQIDNVGNVFVLSALIQTNIWSTIISTSYRVARLNIADDSVKILEIKPLPHKISSMAFRPSESGGVICSGFFMDNKNEGIRGVAYFRSTSDFSSWVVDSYSKFEVEFLSTFLSESQNQRLKLALEKGDSSKLPVLSQYHLDHIILRSDGGALVIAEQSYVIERTQPFNYMPWGGGFYGFGWGMNRYNNRRVDYEFHFGDIIALNVKPNGEIEWASSIPKEQVTLNDNGIYSSYAMTVSKDKIYILYNDNIKNFKSKSNDFVFEGVKGSVIAVAEISKDGQSNIFAVPSSQIGQLPIRPKICRSLQRKSMTLISEYNKVYRIGKIEFN